MEIKPKPAAAEVMHNDLNSAFAMTEQQADPLLRGRPVGVTNRLNDYAICIAASDEAKRLGINLGTRNGEAKVIAPNFVMCESDSSKYQYVHKQMQAIFASFSPSFTIQSVGVGVFDFVLLWCLLEWRTLMDVGLVL